MKPPADGVHRYYVQVFALDSVLDLEGALVGNFEKPALVDALP